MSREPESICIVDNDASVRPSIERLLDSDGLNAQSFEHPEDFLAHVSCKAVRLAVLDVWMPRMSGLEVQSRLHEVSPDTKVIIITGRETAAISRRCAERRRVGLLAKPFDDGIFLSLVRKALCSAA